MIISIASWVRSFVVDESAKEYGLFGLDVLDELAFRFDGLVLLLDGPAHAPARGCTPSAERCRWS